MNSKVKSFLDYFDMIDEAYGGGPMPDDAKEFLESLRQQQEKEENKPLFTETGLQILEYLQSYGEDKLKAKDIADGMEMSSRKISGSIRKLVTDGYVEKHGTNPVIYALTEQGKNFNIESYKGD
jgi:DNA-binding MarR family transcriptional regulator